MKDCWKMAILCARAGRRSTPGTGRRALPRVRFRGGELLGREWVRERARACSVAWRRPRAKRGAKRKRHATQSRLVRVRVRVGVRVRLRVLVYD